MALADVYDALISKRAYKSPWPHEKAVDEIRRCSGTHFDPELLDRFAAIARPLHQALAGDEGDYPQQEVQRILTRYFREDVETLLAADLTA